MKTTIRGGTQLDERLCDHCHYAQIMSDGSQKEQVLCNAFHGTPLPITIRVTSCTRFSDKRRGIQPSLDTMMQMAFVLTEQTPLKKAGFISAREWRKDQGKR